MLNKVIKPVLATIDAISVNTGKLFSWLILALVGIIVIEVFRRYALNAPIMGVQDATCAYFGAYYTMAGAYTLWAAGHVRVDVLWALAPPRGRAIMDSITFPFFVIFLVGMIYTGWQFGMMATYITGVGWNLEVDQSHMRLPLYPAKWTIFIGSVLLLFQGVAKFVRDLKFGFTGKELG
ncbi:MAG: TRAP transporter small permease subunit [Dehalococcoidales bacterium]